MYRVILHKVVDEEHYAFVNNPRSEFYLSSSEEVCSLITKLPQGWFLSLLQFDFDSVEDIISNYDFNV